MNERASFSCYKPLFHFQMHFTLVVYSWKACLLHMIRVCCVLEQSQQPCLTSTKIKLFIFLAKILLLLLRKTTNRWFLRIILTLYKSLFCIVLFRNDLDKNWILYESAFKKKTWQRKQICTCCCVQFGKFYPIKSHLVVHSQSYWNDLQNLIWYVSYKLYILQR